MREPPSAGARANWMRPQGAYMFAVSGHHFRGPVFRNVIGSLFGSFAGAFRDVCGTLSGLDLAHKKGGEAIRRNRRLVIQGDAEERVRRVVKTAKRSAVVRLGGLAHRGMGARRGADGRNAWLRSSSIWAGRFVVYKTRAETKRAGSVRVDGGSGMERIYLITAKRRRRDRTKTNCNSGGRERK